MQNIDATFTQHCCTCMYQSEKSVDSPCTGGSAAGGEGEEMFRLFSQPLCHSGGRPSHGRGQTQPRLGRGKESPLRVRTHAYRIRGSTSRGNRLQPTETKSESKLIKTRGQVGGISKAQNSKRTSKCQTILFYSNRKKFWRKVS